MKVNRNLKLLFSIMLLLVFCSPLYALSGKTHKAVTEKAIAASVLDDYLRTELGIDEGINAEFQYNVEMYDAYIKRRMVKGGVENPYNPTRTILKWIKAGSAIEDEDGNWRLFNF